MSKVMQLVDFTEAEERIAQLERRVERLEQQVKDLELVAERTTREPQED